ncbi:MAG TPA: ABC transporter permease subunit [Clostridium sp.]
MIFTLVKNELIKILRRGKTWIVFGLFALSVIGVGFLGNYSAKQTENYKSPQGQIESLNRNIEMNNQQIKNLESNEESWAKTEIERMNSSTEEIKEQIKVQEERLNNGDAPNAWKTDLQQEKMSLEKMLEDKSIPEEARIYQKTRLDEINMFLDKDVKPVEEWEFNAFNYADGLLQIIGLIILVSGIAVFMSDIVSGESTPPTLKFLLVQPISRGKVILSKFIAVVITVVGMIGGLELAAFGIIGAIGGFNGGQMPKIIGTQYQWDYSKLSSSGDPFLNQIQNSGVTSTRAEALFQSFGLEILFIIACCAFIFLISSIFKSSMITMAISVIVSVTSTMVCLMSSTVGKVAHLIFLNYGATNTVIDGSVARGFNNPNFSVGLGAALMVGTIIVSYIIAHIVFSKKDFLI